MRLLTVGAMVAASVLGGAASSGCIVAAAAAGAGAGTGIYLTSRGVESLVEGSVDEVTARSQSVFTALDIRATGEEIDHDAGRRELHGVKDDLDVTVKVEREDATTSRVEVTARRNLAEWDKDYAREVLARIVAK